MTLLRGVRSVRHLQRYREVAQVLLRHGLRELVELLDLTSYASLGRRAKGRREQPTAASIPKRLRMALEDLGPAAIKLGQVLSTRPDLLPPRYIAEFSRLQDTVPPAPWEPVKQLIEREYDRPIERVFQAFHPVPIAAASLSQVYDAVLHSGAHVAVKVQRPGIRPTVETDLEILSDIAKLLEERIALSEVYNLPSIAREFSLTLRAELDFYQEAHNADRFRANFAGERVLHIPEIHWQYTTHSIIVMEHLDGIKVDNIAALDTAGYNRRRIAASAARILVKEVLEDGFFHADPHPGNFVVLPGERIGAMDFGMVGHLSLSTRTDLVRLYVAAMRLDEEAVVDQMIQLGAVGGSLDRRGLTRDVSRLLRKYHGLPLKAIRASDVFEEVMPIAFRHHINLPTELWLLNKTLAMMEGVGRKLDPDFNAFAVFRPHAQRFLLKMASPKWWGPSLIKAGLDWSELLTLIPRVGQQFLAKAERGEFEMTINHEGLQNALDHIDSAASRLSLSLLMAALIVGLALLVPAFNLGQEWNLPTILVISSFVIASILGLLLVFSIWRSR